jgi:hypothetical protein
VRARAKWVVLALWVVLVAIFAPLALRTYRKR